MKSFLFSYLLIAAVMNGGCQTVHNGHISADIEIILLGDVNLQTGAGAYRNRSDPSSAFINVMDTLRGADFRYCNMEGLYGQTVSEAFPEKPGWWHSQSDMLAGMIAAGFDVVGLANNASVGDAEILNTISMLESANIRHVGAGANRAAARAPVIMTIGDTRFGILQYTARYYSEDFVATPTTPGVARLKTTGNTPNAADLAEIVAEVKALSTSVDVIFFSHHVRKSGKGIEPYQRKLARAVIAAGVDLVFGHGPHVNQGVEIIDGVAVLHSLSNFAFDWWKMADRNDGLLVKVVVRDKKIVRVSFVPVSRDENNNVFLTPPGTTEGNRQINDVQRQSPGVSLTIEGSEVVLPLGVEVDWEEKLRQGKNKPLPGPVSSGLIVTDLGKNYSVHPEVTPANLYFDDTDKGGNTSTSVRNDAYDNLEWKDDEGYYQRNRDLGMIFNPIENMVLDAIVLRTSGSNKAVKTGAPGAPVIMQIFEVVGTPVLNNNGTGEGDTAEGRYGDSHAMDDYVEGVEYVQLLLATGGTFPIHDVTSSNDDKGKLRFMRWDITNNMHLIGGKRYMFLVGFENPIHDCSIALANINPITAQSNRGDNIYLHTDPAGKKWWGVRREGNSTYPPTRAPGSAPFPEPGGPLKSQLKTESIFENDRLTNPEDDPVSDGFPSIDTYRTLQFYIETTDGGITYPSGEAHL